MIDKVKRSLRVKNDAFNTEIADLIEAAQLDLVLSGVSNAKAFSEDPLILRAITIYCKAHFGYDNPDADRLQKAYDLLKTHLTISGDYHAVE